MGAANAHRMLAEGWKPTAAEAKAAGFITSVVPHERLLPEAQVSDDSVSIFRRWVFYSLPIVRYSAVLAVQCRRLGKAGRPLGSEEPL